jgi:hypothetical protein
MGNPMERDFMEDQGVDGRLILKWICSVGWRGMYQIDLAQDRDRWRAIVNAGMNFRFP